MQTRLKQMMSEVCAEHQAEIEEREVMPDHVHLLVTVEPQFGIHRRMKRLKGRSSRFLRHAFPVVKRKLPRFWTNSYFVSTTGDAPLSIITQYIEQQKHVSQDISISNIPDKKAREDPHLLAHVVV